MDEHTDSPIRVVVIDDHEMVRQGTVLQINAQPHMRVVSSAGTCQAALANLNGRAPDVALIDLDLAGEDAFVTAETLCLVWPHLRVILLATVLSDAVIDRALSSNICGVVTKRDAFKTVQAAIEGAAVGKCVFSRTVFRCSPRGGDCAVPGDSCLAPGSRLTPREYEVLASLATGRSVKETAYRMGLARTTVDNHKTRIMRKIDVHSSVELARYAIREGLITP